MDITILFQAKTPTGKAQAYTIQSYRKRSCKKERINRLDYCLRGDYD